MIDSLGEWKGKLVSIGMENELNARKLSIETSKLLERLMHTERDHASMISNYLHGEVRELCSEARYA